MIELLVFCYALGLVAAFLGASALPRLRWLLLTLATLGTVLPVALVVLLLVYLSGHPMHHLG
jgi:hypothetical protein